MRWLDELPTRAGVRYLSPPGAFAAQEEEYVRIREREGRLFADDLARALPRLPASHPLAAEWRLRADSAARLARHASRHFAGRAVLDLGCGNGWLANVVARATPACTVVGLDINRAELEQAARVFGGPRAQFVYGDVFSPGLPAGVLGAVVVASALQYFADAPGLVRRLLDLLAPGGELHILDSPLYAAGEVADAQRRTREYFGGLGLPAPAHYHAHALSALTAFEPTVMYDPRAARHRLARGLGAARSPFIWLRIRKPA